MTRALRQAAKSANGHAIVMRIAVVLHGPEVIDSGFAKRVLGVLARHGTVTAKLGGTMGRTAVIDAALEDVIDISERLKPSECFEKLSPRADLLVLLNQGKTRETGTAFGSLVVSRTLQEKPLLQIDGAGMVIPWTADASDFAAEMAGSLGIELVPPPELKPYIERLGGTVKRRIFGIRPGENILLNGVVIGRANSGDVIIVAENGRISGLIGGEIKQHGLEKLDVIDLEKAAVKSGAIRRTTARPRLLQRSGHAGGAVLIDHCAEASFEAAKDADIAGEVLSRLGVPVIGLTDGDIDVLSAYSNMPGGSMVLRLKQGMDDIVGGRVKAQVFDGRHSADISRDELRQRVLDIAGEDVEHVSVY